MNKFLLATMALLLLAANTDAQSKKKRPIPKQQRAAVNEVLLPAEYEIHVVTANKLGVILVQIAPTPTYPATSESSFSEFLKGHFGVKAGPLNIKHAYPKIIVKFVDDDDILALTNAVQLGRGSDKAVVKLDAMSADVRLIVAPKKTKIEMADVTPNPLTLIVEMSEQKTLTLNNEEIGDLTDMSRVVKFLKEIFRWREVNGVFRENSYDVEKTVFIKMPLTGKAADLIKIAQALQEAGSDQIGFQVDETADQQTDLELILPDIVAPKKKALPQKNKTIR